MMKRALALAGRGQGWVEPNPMVGCVIVQDGRVVGEGYHRRFGGWHAEIEALRACSVSPRGATVYVSLEPCCHAGKTPPCTAALIEAEVARVVIAQRDPNPTVDGRGIRQLQAAGIAVDVGLLGNEAAELLAPYMTRILLGRPYVIAKWAQTLDGKLATRTGDSKWISGEVSRRRVHLLRARVDAILVGAGTVAMDDPLLTARDVPLRRQALRVVLDGLLRIPGKRQLLNTAQEVPTIVMTTPRPAQTAKAKRMIEKGVEVIAWQAYRDRLTLRSCLAELHDREVTNLLIEGGPTIFSTFFAARLIDEAFVFTAPKMIGDNRAPGVLRGQGVARIAAALTPLSVETQRFGADILHHLRFTEPPSAAK